MTLLPRSFAPLLVAAAYLGVVLAPCPAGVERVEHDGHVHAVPAAVDPGAQATPWLAPICPCGCEQRSGASAFWGRTGVALLSAGPEPPAAAPAPAPLFAGATPPPEPVSSIDPVPI